MAIQLNHQDVQNNLDKIFVYGDNDLRQGKGGQAIIRDLPNTIGLRTKKLPSLSPNAFYTDTEFSQNKLKIDEDINTVKTAIANGKTIALIAFWDMKSLGTKNMIELAKKYNLDVTVIDVSRQTQHETPKYQSLFPEENKNQKERNLFKTAWRLPIQ